MDIHLGRGNALRILATALQKVTEVLSANVADIKGELHTMQFHGKPRLHWCWRDAMCIYSRLFSRQPRLNSGKP